AAKPQAARKSIYRPCPLFRGFSTVNRLLLSASLFLFLSCAVRADDKQPLRAGIIGLDTSHVEAFTKLLNNPKAKPELAGIRVVAAFKGGSPDVKASASRVEGFTKKLRDDHGVEI